MDKLLDLGISILGNLLFVLFSIVVGYIWVLAIRRKFNDFFGLNKKNSISIILSNLWDSSATDRKQWGEIVSGLEMNGARVISNMFSSASLGLPEVIRGIAVNYWMNDKFTVRVSVSPKNYEYKYSSETLIVAGATTKNSVRRYFVKNQISKVIIKGEPINEPMNIHENNLSNEFEFLTSFKNAEKDKKEYPCENSIALIERIEIKSPELNSKDTQVIFMCLGKSSKQTKFALLHLKDNWKDIKRDCHGKGKFTLILYFDEEGKLKHEPIKI